MAAWSWRAVDARGKRARGVLEAANAGAARRALRERALLPLDVRRARDGAGAAGGARLPGRALVLMTRQLATLVGAGVRIEDALRTLAAQKGQPKVGALLLELRAAILDGRSFAAALDDHPRSFDAFFRASVRVGEQTGRLGEVLDHLADHVEARAANRQTVQLALLYPALLALVSVGVITALLVFVVPDIVRVFATRGAELPWLTRALIAVSEGAGTVGPVLLAGMVALGIGAAAALRVPATRRAWHRTLCRLPGIGSLVRQVASAGYASTLATLTVARVPLHEALVAAAATVGNLHVRARAVRVADRVREGMAIHRAMEEAEIFPPMLIAMTASGEASGRLGETLSRAAAQQNKALEARVATIVGLVEPGVLLLMGGIVMLLVMAILMPIMGLNQIVE